MKTRCLISLMVVAAIMIFSQPALADDLADLKAAHKKILRAVNTGDVQSMFEIWQEGAIYISTEFGFPMVTSRARGIQVWSKLFEKYVIQSMWYKVDYRVIGNTGLAWGTRTLMVRNKATGVGKRSFVRTSQVWVKSEGKWGAVMEHNSPIPKAQDLF